MERPCNTCCQAGLRELVPMLRDILDSPRKVFQNWIKWASSGHDAARMCQSSSGEPILSRCDIETLQT